MKTYTWKRGDTFKSIAEKLGYGHVWLDLLALNSDTIHRNGNIMYEGDKVAIPTEWNVTCTE